MALVAVATPAFADDAADRIDKARTTVLTDEYQGELDDHETGDGLPHEQHAEHRDDRRRIDTRQEATMGEAGPVSTVFSFLMWGVVIVGVALTLFWLVSELVKYGGDDAEIADDGKPQAAMPDLAVIERPLGDAEELAMRGDFTEAIHTLLLRTLQELVRSAAVSVKPAMTSREILARVPLLADAREALAGLITAVEVTHFGGDEATVDDYQRCRAQFQKFATAFRASGTRADYHTAGAAA